MSLPLLLGAAALLLLASGSGSARRLSVVPVVAKRTSGFGWRHHPILKKQKFHNGLDMGAPTGTPIVAAGDGVVEFAGWNSGYGNLVRIDHGKGLSTRYGHQSKLFVVAGQRVRAGQKIGLVGSTGMSTGPHLHFEVRENGVPVHPGKYLPELK